MIVETMQTIDTFHIEGQITLVGRAYFRKSWDLSLGEAKSGWF